MSEEILAQVRAELAPKGIKDVLVLLAAEVRETRKDVADIKALYEKEDAQIAVNCNRLTQLEATNKAAKGIIGAIVAVVMAVIAKLWSE
jgi:hypothetical protein